MAYGIEVAAFALASLLLSSLAWYKARIKELEEEIQRLHSELETIKNVSVIREVEIPEKEVVEVNVK